jgi:hypothetical protein
MSNLLNIFAALLLVVLPVTNPCTAHGMTFFCTCQFGLVDEAAAPEQEQEPAGCAGCCSAASRTQASGEEPGPSRPHCPCPGSDRSKRPDSAYSVDGVPAGPVPVTAEPAPELHGHSVPRSREDNDQAALGYTAKCAGCYERPPPNSLLLTGTVRLLL